MSQRERERERERERGRGGRVVMQYRFSHMDTFSLLNPFLLHHLSLSAQLLQKNKSVLKRLIFSAASSLS